MLTSHDSFLDKLPSVRSLLKHMLQFVLGNTRPALANLAKIVYLIKTYLKLRSLKAFLNRLQTRSNL